MVDRQPRWEFSPQTQAIRRWGWQSWSGRYPSLPALPSPFRSSPPLFKFVHSRALAGGGGPSGEFLGIYLRKFLKPTLPLFPGIILRFKPTLPSYITILWPLKTTFSASKYRQNGENGAFQPALGQVPRASRPAPTAALAHPPVRGIAPRGGTRRPKLPLA